MPRKGPPTASRRPAVLAEGYRPLTRAELVKLGRSPTSRAFTTQKSGVKRLAPEKVVSRRQAEKIAAGVRPERAAKENRARGGGRTFTDRAYSYAREWAAKKGIGVREAQRDPEFRRLYREATKTPDGRTTAKRRKQDPPNATDRARSRKRLRALHDLGAIDDDEFAELYELYEEQAA